MEQQNVQTNPGIIFNKDGSITRIASPVYPDTPANAEFHDGVATKDLMLDPEINLWVRVFLPQLGEEEDHQQLLPVVFYFHGGGFIIINAATAQFDAFCRKVSKKLRSFVVSVNYRLAPEHKLPAAYDDGFSALKWLDDCFRSRCGKPESSNPQRGSDIDLSWFVDRADSAKVFVAGDSAGGNLALNVALRAAQEFGKEGLMSFRLAGQILLQPFFGSVARTEAELTLSGPLISLSGCDDCWKAALPEGADRDHRFCNPAVKLREELELVGDMDGFAAKTLVVVGGLDMLKDKQFEFARIVEESGKDVKVVVYPNAGHAFYVMPGTPETPLLLEEMAVFCSR